MTAGLASQGGLIAVAEFVPEGRASQAGLIAVAAIVPHNGVSQAGLIVVAFSSPCSEKRCQLWSIHRTDGVAIFLTSHDQDVTWGAATYRTCGSLMESASEQSADQGDVGNIDLEGIFSDDAITAADLYAGKFDDAYIQVWEKSWDDETAMVRRIAAGWAGSVSQGDGNFKAEVLGPGARMLQKPLLRTIAPGCRWEFGDPTTCGVDAEARMVPGAAITAVTARAFFTCDAVDPANGSQWNRGKVRWLTGPNAGTICAVKTVDFATGLVVLWEPTGFLGQVGDTFDLLPGCDLAFEGGCTAYANKERFGGYPTVPGSDAMRQVPNVKAD